MSRTLIPVKIRPHLVPFLFREFTGVDAHYQNRRVKAVRVSLTNSLGKIIRYLAEKSDVKPVCDQKYAIFLSITEQISPNQTQYFGKVYRFIDGRSSFLKIPEEGQRLINDHLESIFRTSMMYYVQGCDEGEVGISNGIKLFMDKYELWQFGFDPESLRRNYYRWRKEEKRLSFFTNNLSHRMKRW